MPTVDIGKVRPTFAGEWDENTAYEAVTVVMFEGTAYQSAMNTPAGALPTAPNSVYWFPIGWRGKKGEDGEPGKPGDDGKPGPPGPTMPISDSVTSPDSGVAASSMAVKMAYDVATGAQTTANTAQSTAETVQGTANTANTNAANAQNTANTANSTANTATTNISSLSGRMGTAESNITALNGKIQYTTWDFGAGYGIGGADGTLWVIYE